MEPAPRVQMRRVSRRLEVDLEQSVRADLYYVEDWLALRRPSGGSKSIWPVRLSVEPD